MMETTNTLNSGMCRCCSSEGTFKDIKTKYHWMGEEEVYADMLNDCFDIKIHTPEDTDDGICEVCITQLRNAANFKKQVLHTEEQFKKRLQNKEIKNPIKLESVDDPMDSDHLSDPDFSAAEYEVPIKEEMEDKPKGKKRTAKATTSRGKKAKPEAESSKRLTHEMKDIVEWDATEMNNDLRTILKLAESSNLEEDGNANNLQLKKERDDQQQNIKVIKVKSLKSLHIMNVKQKSFLSTLNQKSNIVRKIGPVPIGDNPVKQISTSMKKTIKEENVQPKIAINQGKSSVDKPEAVLRADNVNICNELEEDSFTQVEYIDEAVSPYNSDSIEKPDVALFTNIEYIDNDEEVSITNDFFENSEVVSLLSVECVDDSGEFWSSNIEYLEEIDDDVTKPEDSLESPPESKILQRLKRKAGKTTARKRKANVKKFAAMDSKLLNIKKNITVTPRKVPIGSEIDFHHENLRTVLRCSNATPFSCRRIWYNCVFCCSKYVDARDLKAHTLQLHDPEETKCRNKLYSDRQLKRYIVKLDISNLKCKLCGKDINSLKELMEHLDEEHSETIHMDLPNHIIPFRFESDKLRCAECSRVFACFKMLICHMNDHYPNYICELCNSGYVTYGSLTQHLNKHADGEYPCKDCEKTYDNRLKLIDHVKIVHLGKRNRNKCAYCPMEFQIFEDRAKHMEEEHGLKAPVVQCQACDRSFMSTRQLTRHVKKFHLSEKQHQCSLCDMRFHAAYMLRDHMTVHSVDKDFKCGVCDKAFARKKTLREHMRIHTNDRRFKCEYCGMTFIQKCSLIGHLKNKHGYEEKKN